MPVLFHTYFGLAAGYVLLVSCEAMAAAKNSRSLHDILAGKGTAKLLNMKQLAGITICSAVIFYYYSIYDHDLPFLHLDWNTNWSIHSLAFAMLALIAGYSSAKESNRNRQERIPGFTTIFFIPVYLLLRSVYLIVYECLFRGIMLLLFINTVGTNIGIVLSTLFYTLAHSYSSRKEIIGTIPFGFLLCCLTLVHQSVWPAIIIHLLLALSNEIRSLKNKYLLIKSSQL